MLFRSKYVLFVTKNGIVKKTSLEEYVKTKKKSGIAAISIKEGDSLVSVALVNEEDIILLTSQGMGIRFNANDIGPTSRVTMGIKGMNLKADDSVVAMLPVRNATDKLAIFSDAGLGKKMDLTELPVQKRGGKGLICYKNGGVTCGALVEDADNLLVMGNLSNICISATEIPLLGRPSIGNQILKGKIVSVSKV